MKKANEKTVPKNSLSLSASAIDKHQCNEILHKDTRTQRKAVLGYCLLICFFHYPVSFMTDFICAFFHCLISFRETRKGTFRTGVLFDLSLLLYLAQKIWDHVTSFLWSCMVQSGLLPSSSMSGCLMGNVIHSWQSRGKE